MKLFLLALFLAVATANPIPDDSGPVDVIVNGVPEGEAVELGNIVDIKLQEHADGDVVATSNLLHPFTAVGIAEAAAAAQPDVVDVPESVVLPLPDVPEVILTPVVLPNPVEPEVVQIESSIPEPIVLPVPAMPEVIPEPVVLPAPVQPEVVPSPIVLPSPAVPEVVPEAVAPVIVPEAVIPEDLEVEPIPVPAAQLPSGEIFNDGTVQVSVNGPEEPGFLSTLQSWLNMAINYVNSSGAETTQQII